jgi:hypothetical protein
MKNYKRKRILNLELTGALLAICAGLLGIGMDRLGFPSQAYLPAIFGLLITASASLLKFELMERIDRDYKIQTLLNQLEHEALRKHGIEAIEACEDILEDLGRGIIKTGSAEIFKIIVELVDHTWHHIQAIHLANDLSYLYSWECNEGLMNYYQANLNALKRNVTIERVFLLKKEDIIDSKLNKVINQKVVNILNNQQRDGIKVFVTWLESVANPELIEDFIIFDDEEVTVHYPLTEGRYHRTLTLYEPVNIRNYKQRFADLKVLGQPLDRVLATVDQGSPTQ